MAMEFPEFLVGVVTPQTYWRWLHRKATAHVVRDRKRSHQCGVSQYKSAIHEAVLASGGKDCYTGVALDWHLISTYDNDKSKEGRHAYKSQFALLPTVDHVEADSTSASFRICSWQANDAKNDLALPAFLALCVQVLEHAGYRVQPPSAPAR